MCSELVILNFLYNLRQVCAAQPVHTQCVAARAKNKNAENNRHIDRIIYGEYFGVRRINCIFTAKLAEKKYVSIRQSKLANL
jgi:hypothetical protein